MELPVAAEARGRGRSPLSLSIPRSVERRDGGERSRSESGHGKNQEHEHAHRSLKRTVCMFPLVVRGRDPSSGPISYDRGYAAYPRSDVDMRNRGKEKGDPDVCYVSLLPSLLPRSAIRDRRRCVLRSGMIMRQRKVCLGAPGTRMPLPP